MTLEFYLLLAHSDTALLALIALLGIFYSGRNKTDIKLIGLLGVAGFLSNMLGFLSVKLKWSHLINLPSSVYDFVLITIVTILYNNETNRKHKWYFLIVASFYIVVSLLNMIFIQQGEISSYSKLLGSLIIITYAIVYFYRLMVDLPTYEVHRLPMFWFNSSFLIYHAGTVFLF